MMSLKPKFCLRGSESEISSVAFHSKEELLLAGGDDGTVAVWDLRERRRRIIISKNVGASNDDHDDDENINSVNGNSVVSVRWDERDESVFVYQRRNGTVEKSSGEKIQTNSVVSFAKIVVMPNTQGNVFVAAGEDSGCFQIWDWRSPHHSNVFTNNINDSNNKEGMIMSLDFCSDDNNNYNYLLCGLENGMVNIYDIRFIDNQKKNANFVKSIICHNEPVICVKSFKTSKSKDNSSENLQMLTGSADNIVHIHNFNNTSDVDEGSVILPNSGVNDIAIRNDGRIFAIASWDETIYLYSTKDYYTNSEKTQKKLQKRELANLEFHKGSVRSLSYSSSSSSSNLLASAGKDKVIAIWDLYA